MTNSREPTTGDAVRRTLGWFFLAVMFGMWVMVDRGSSRGFEFFTAYLLELALSVDNLFVMMLVFARFRVPRESQQRVLTWGIIGVVVLRGVMIVTGTALVETFHALTYALGAVLLYSAYKLGCDIGSHGGDGNDSQTPSAITKRMRSLLGRFMPISDEYAGSRFTIVKDGTRFATPLLLALLTIEAADAVFALDSIPAVFGVTTDRFIVFTSNLFAVLGLRSLYFALSGLLEKLRYLQHGLVGVLALIGIKMMLAIVWSAPAWLSLSLVALILGGAIVASLSASSLPKGINAEQP